MRATLLNPLREQHRSRRRPAQARPALRAVAQPPRDPDVERARMAGRSLDRASYNCECGCVFDAAVTTTVTCPHCGTMQAW